MKISVVVPAFNEEKLIASTLRSIKSALGAFAELGWETEVIVCNNNSTDRTGELAEAEGAKVVFEPINQISRARNTGAAAATGDWLVFVDADSLPSRALFADTARHIQTGRYIAGGVIVKLDDGPPIAHFVAGMWNWVSRMTKWCAGSYIFCDAAAFRQIGGFSLELFASEELDLSNRLRRMAKNTGKKMVILRKAPLITSGRKVNLYSKRTHMKLFISALLRPSATLKDRDRCILWYDGRR